MKRFVLLLLVGAMLMLAACQRSVWNAGGTGEPTATEATGTAQPATAATETAGTEETAETEEELPKDVLDGSWELLVCGQIERGQFSAATLTFLGEQGNFTFTKGGNSISGSYELGEIAADGNGLDKLTLTPHIASYGYGSGDAMDVPVEFEFIHCACNGSEVLAIRELAYNGLTNGDNSPYTNSALGMENFGYSYCAYDDFWVFVRNRVGVEELSDKENDSLRRKDSVFYAYRWLAYDDVSFLQEMAWKDVTVAGQSLVDYTYAEIGRGATAVWYKTADYLLDEINEMEGRSYLPKFVRVRTDANGKVIEMIEASRAFGNDYFPVIDGAGNEYRDPDVFGKADAFFLGTWRSDDDPNLFLVVQKASKQVGGYELVLRKGAAVQATCYANLSGEDLQVNQGSFATGENLSGVLKKNDSGVTFTVDESGLSIVPVGASFDFSKA